MFRIVAKAVAVNGAKVCWRNKSSGAKGTYNITRKELNKILLKSNSFFESSVPRDVLPSAPRFQGDPVSKEYLPFHSVDVRGLVTRYTALYGLERTVSCGEGKTRTVIDWYPCEGTLSSIDYPFGLTKETQIYAGLAYPRKYVHDALQSPDVANIERWTGIAAEDNDADVSPHEIKRNYGMELCIGAIHDMELHRVRDKVANRHWTSHVRAVYLDMQLNYAAIKMHSYHVPAYIYSFIYNVHTVATIGRKIWGSSAVRGDGATRLAIQKIICGRTGRVGGESLYSPYKTGLLAAALGFAAAVATIPLRSNPVVFFGILGARWVMASGAAGALGSAWALWWPLARYKLNRSKIDNESNRNSKFQFTADDDILLSKARRVRKAQNGTPFSNEETSSRLLPESECILLGIDRTKVLRKQFLKSRYRGELMKWHPDKYNGDKEVANMMRARINIA